MSDNAQSTGIHTSRGANRFAAKVAIIILASEEARFITSEMINIDGGCAVKI